jgi:hypothetical protein
MRNGASTELDPAASIARPARRRAWSVKKKGGFFGMAEIPNDPDAPGVQAQRALDARPAGGGVVLVVRA